MLDGKMLTIEFDIKPNSKETVVEVLDSLNRIAFQMTIVIPKKVSCQITIISIFNRFQIF